MNIGPGTSRISLHRKYKRLMLALQCLVENEILPKGELERRKKKIDAIYEEWREERKRVSQKSERGRGRPKTVTHRFEITVCKKAGCTQPPAKGQAYCKREHAPYGFYDVQTAQELEL